MEMNLPWVESPFFERILQTKDFSEDELKLVRDFNQNGFAVIKNAYSDEEINAVKKEMDEKAFNPQFNYENMRDERRSQDLWMYSEPVRQMSCKPSILSVLEKLYDREVVPFQTLNFKFGSQQRAHSDTIHFSSLPPRFMCGVWVALEDITEENGPLFYYPGSHKTPEFNFNDFRSDMLDSSYDNYTQYEDFIEDYLSVTDFKKNVFMAKKGDALIWSSNIIHGGSPVLKEGTSRYSQVTHYFFKDCLYYTPMNSNTLTGEWAMRTSLKNMRNGNIESTTYNGIQPNLVRSYKKLYLINNHIFYPNFLRKISDVLFVVKNFGMKELIRLVKIKLFK
ncbi:phytanoyl-CoA dioxygenase family protein [Sandaracinomonas limnophila]|uniref:Phytanoyl-CoA dioxygenase family protein n=1 Tax=Sandaracinomonas limnophila TaxID=1862386 RepID=A0A437PXK7_9BACT|nr:phytanoyl-CoA dioxygenase family protein [Sandaracinomonas limnophila]RVU26991.1 phytanoyl-CoA dioxygenase family protein [Sandaracinomonas limnophila]